MSARTRRLGLAAALGLRAGRVLVLRPQTSSVHEGRIMTLLSFLRALSAPAGRTAPVRSCRPLRRRAPSISPFLECLEDRTVPTTWSVTSSLDDVALLGTLRNAIYNAQNGDTIIVKTNQLAGPIVLTHGELLLNKDLTIRTSGSGLATIDGNHANRVFEVASGHTVSLANLYITNGATASTVFGGGILNAGTLTLSGCTVSGNDAGESGGGIYNSAGGTLTVSGCTVSGNASVNDEGGGIGSGYLATLTVSGSTVSGNTAASAGGGIANFQGTLAVSDCTLSGNSGFYGGGIFTYGGPATVGGSTLSSNSAYYGGGIFNEYATLTVSGSTLSGNSAFSGGGLYNFRGTLTVNGSTLSSDFATSNAGAVDNYQGTVTVSNSTVTGNAALSRAGGIYNEGGATLTASDSTLSGNSAADGGGIFNLGQLTVNDKSTVSGNHATLGADLYEYASLGATLSVLNSTIDVIYFA
jgi:hypothetical protein